MDLAEQTFEVSRVLRGTDSFIISSGTALRIETSPGGADIYDGDVPEGKQWRVEITLKTLGREH